MSLLDFYNLDELKNANEAQVWEVLEEIYQERSDLCRCRDCILDAAALALNSLPPRYRVYSLHTNQQNLLPLEDIRRVVEESLATVKERPHHF